MNLSSTIKSLFQDNDTKDILQKGLYALLIKLGGVGLGFLFTWIIATQYGADVNGIFSLALTVFMLITILSRAGFDMSLTRIFSENKEKGQLAKAKKVFNRAMGFCLTASLVLAITLYFLAPFLAEKLFHSPRLATSFQYMSLAIPAWTVTMISAGALRGLGHSSAFTFYFNMGRFLFAVILLVLATFLFSGNDPSIPAICYTSSCILLALASLIHVHLKTHNATGDEEAEQLPELVRVSIPMLFASSLLFIMGWLDRIVLGIYATDADVGIYHVAMKLSTLTAFTLTAVNAVVAPKFAAHYSRGNMKQFNSVVKNASLAILLSSLPIIGVLLLFPENILAIFGDEFTVAVPILFILLAGQLISVLCGSVGMILQMTGHQKTFQNTLLVAALLNIILNFALCPIYGMTGVAIASLVAIATWNLLALYMVRKLTGVFTFYNPLRLFPKSQRYE